MKIFLVTRGSHGDIYPYLVLASELTRRGHYVTLSLPELFEKEARASGLNYILQRADDIGGMLEGAARNDQSFKYILGWIRRVIDTQFEQFIPVLQQHDILVSANTEFAAVSIAEYCRKPIVRTAYAPLIPGKKIPPPIMPLSGIPFLSPGAKWSILNKGTDFMVRKTLNKNREKLGMASIKKYGAHAAGNACNYLMHSRYLGETDPGWAFRWEAGGYCFNNTFDYDPQAYARLMEFIEKDDRPILFFTLGSCDAKKKNSFCERLWKICRELDYRLVVGTGWSKAGSGLDQGNDLFLLTQPIPHSLIFPHCRAVIHHGGSGTTHSVALAGEPQMIVPLIIDQDYWASRVRGLGIGPGKVRITVSEKSLKQKVADLVNNEEYAENARLLAQKIATEDGVGHLCDYIESFGGSKTQDII